MSPKTDCPWADPAAIDRATTCDRRARQPARSEAASLVQAKGRAGPQVDRGLGVKIGKTGQMRSRRSRAATSSALSSPSGWRPTRSLLILDSPTVGVDVGARAGIFAIVRKLAEAGMAILLISDEIPEVYFNADRRPAHARRAHRRPVPAQRRRHRCDRGGRPCLGLRNRRDRALADCRHRCVMGVGLSVLTSTFLTLPNLFDLLNASSVNIIFGVGPAGRADRRRHRHLVRRRGLGRPISDGADARMARRRRLGDRPHPCRPPSARRWAASTPSGSTNFASSRSS